MQKKSIEKEIFLNGKQTNRSTRSVSESPLFIDARGKKEKIEEKIRWRTRRVCLFHGESFRWKNRCRHCHYLVTFPVRLD